MTAFFDWLDWALEAYDTQVVAGIALLLALWVLRLWRKLEQTLEERDEYEDRMLRYARWLAEIRLPDPQPAPGYDETPDLQAAFCCEVRADRSGWAHNPAPRHKLPKIDRIPVAHIYLEDQCINTLHWN